MAILLKKPKWFNYCINSRILNPIYAVEFIQIRKTLTNHIQKNSQHFICRRNHQAGMTTGISKKFQSKNLNRQDTSLRLEFQRE